MTQLEFFAALAVIAVAVLWFLWRALASGKDIAADFIEQRGKRFSKLFAEYQAKLDQDLAQDYLDQDEYEIELAHASRKFMAQIDRLEAKKSRNFLSAKTFIPIFFLFLMISAGLYFYVGAYPDLQIKKQLDEFADITDAATFDKKKKALQAMLGKRIEQKPDNVDYRLLKARFAMQDQNYTEAVNQFRILAEMLPKDAQAQAYYAQALFLQNKQVVNPEVEALVDNTLLLDPNNITALGMQGMYAYEQKNYQQAIDAWQKLISLLPADSENAKMIAKGVARAKAQLNPEQQAILEGFNVSVALAETVPLKQLSPNLTVFVFVKAVNGPVFPLAAKRLTLADLPVALSFSDADAMAAAKLSDFQKVQVTARVSTTGTAKASAGDWFGKSAAVVWRDLETALPILINQQSR